MINEDKTGFLAPDRALLSEKMIDKLFDSAKIRMLGRLKPDSVQIIRRLVIAQNTFNLPEWNSAIQSFIEIGISENGKSREEILQMAAGLEKSKTAIEKLKGLNRDKPEAKDI